MLSALHIENIAVIKELNVDFSPGLSVLTGETGAGKSILIGSVRMLLGSKADKDVIRDGENEALVEGLFCRIDQRSLSLLGELDVYPDENGELLLTRRVTRDGRSSCRLNGRAIPLSLLKSVGRILLGIHGQHDTQTLLLEETHLTLLDRYGGCEEQYEKYRESYLRSVSIKAKLSALMKEEGTRELMIEKYAKAKKEISEAALKPGEEEALENRKRILRDAQKLIKQARIVYRALYKNEKGTSAADLSEIAGTALEQLSEVLPEGEKYIAFLDECSAQFEEIAHAVSSFVELGNGNPSEELNRIEDRLELIRALKRKYGDSIEEILEAEKNAEEQLSVLLNRDDELRAQRSELERSVVEARKEGAELHRMRKKAGETLSRAVNEQMAFLDLGKVFFKAEVKELFASPETPKLTSSGIDSVRFLVTTNPGEPYKPLQNVASGGELSRIMLALKAALADKESTPTLVFDEIDTGVSGKTSQKIGIKLRALGRFAQVFCVTHSAQVAACGHHHYLIEKSEVSGRNVTSVKELSDDERIAELARIMGGIHVTQNVLLGAKELLADGQINEE